MSKTFNRETSMTWVQTYTGKRFFVEDPRPEDICIKDIAHALSMVCRFGGHCSRFYSVAEHCCHIFDEAYILDEPYALMHDASEAYLGDIPRPLKALYPGYEEMEARVSKAIYTKFGVDTSRSEAVRGLDYDILVNEKAALMNSHGDLEWPLLPKKGLPDVDLKFWDPREAEEQFLFRAQLCGLDLFPLTPA